nr:integrase, catalytic region, zinc finger, CCHC-type, peptidase aspartic, catalytic [Tanacetum cinerariifolium]
MDLNVVELKRQNVKLQKTQSILKRKMSENEYQYHDTVLNLEAKVKKNVDTVLKIRNSLQGMFMLGPKPMSFYDSKLKHGLGDTEDILEDATKSQVKMKNNMKDPIAIEKKQNVSTIYYKKLNALYKDFVPQKELFTEQKYFLPSFMSHEDPTNKSSTLSHLNFGTINDLTKHDLVDGLSKFKYDKDHLCSACERGKSKKASHPPKLVSSSHFKLELLHIDLYGPMRVASINEKKTKKIMETIHVKFDEFIAMASEHDSLEPVSQRFINDNSSAASMNTLPKEDLDNLFGPMYDEYFEKKSSDMPINSATQQVHNQEDSSSTSSIDIEAHEAPPIVTTFEEQTSLISLIVADEFYQEDSAELDGNALLTSYDALIFSEAESLTNLDPSNMHEFHQVQPSTYIWIKVHPLEQVISDPSKHVMTRHRLKTDPEIYMYALTSSTIKPKNIKEAMSDHSLIESMQD